MIVSEQQAQPSGDSRVWRKDKVFPSRSRSKVHCTFLAICVLSAHTFIAVPAAGQQDSAGEYELKAAMLFNLMQFVEWPPSAYSNSRAPTVLCILGWDPFGNSLTSLVTSKFINGRPVQIRHVKEINGAPACHVLYISSSERNRLVQILSGLKESSVLTVGEMGQFAARGGMVQFALDERRVLLEINLDAASRGDVKISSRVLAIARIVKEQRQNSSLEDSSTGSQEFETAGSRFPDSAPLSPRSHANRSFG